MDQKQKDIVDEIEKAIRFYEFTNDEVSVIWNLGVAAYQSSKKIGAKYHQDK